MKFYGNPSSGGRADTIR